VLDLFLETLRKARRPKLLRVKGIVALSDDPPRPAVSHGVHPPLRLPAWPDGDHTTRIVFILYEMEPAFVETYWRTLADSLNADARNAPIPWPRPSGLLENALPEIIN
jgi:G3E family GTPase